MPLPPSRKRRHSPDNGTEGSGDGQNVKVVVRIRPPNSRESEGNFKIVVQAMDESVLVFDPKENCSSDYGGSRKRPRDLRKRQNRDLKFAFDYVFGPDATNEDVFNETTHVVLSGLLDGYNCSVFAYGATGAGKTHTMLGSKEHPGVMYHTMMDLYNRIDNMKDNKTCDVAMSYLEVYNETIRDLLLPGGSLPIREDPNTGVVVPGLSLHKPKTAEELLYMLQFGNQHRTQHPTDANAESSRSHAVLQVFVRQKDRTANISTEVRVAKLCLVDLAGSERATVTSNRGSRFREGANINRSLLALGNVINALAENKKKGFVPYRDSKLTRLLKDSLGGNCQTVMIAAVSPSAMSYEDTYNTLRYADRAKHIKATLKKNVLNVDFHVAKYGQIVQELRKEIVELKSKLKSYEEGKIISPNAAVLTDSSSSFIGYQRDLAQLFTSHQSVSCNQIQQEVSGRNLQWKIYRKERCLARIQAVDEPCNIESLKKVETMLNGMRQKSSCLDISSKASRSKLESSFKQLSDLEQQMKSAVGTDDNRLPDILSLSVQTHHLQSELENSRQYLAYTKQVIRCQEKELHHNERLLLKLLKLLKREHYIIKGHNMLTSDLQEEYTNIQQRVTGQELCWEDQSETTGYTRGYSLAYMLDLPALNVKSTMTMSGPSQIITNTDKSSVSTVTETERNMSQSTGQVAEVPAYPFKVDECSPPKAKRIMLTASKPQTSAGRVDHHGHSHEYRQTNKGRRTPAKTFPKCGRRRSHSESNVRYTNGVRNGQGDIPSGNVFSMPSRSLGENLSSQKDKSSLVCEEVTNSKFSRLNDTISKSKKFSHLHVKQGTCPQSGNLQETGLDETFTLDSTFTIDPSQNCIPPSSIPCVDPVDPKKFCDSERLLSGVAVNSRSSNVCQKCAINSEQTEEQNLSRQSSSHANYLGISILSSSQSAKTGSTPCLNCSAVKQNHPLTVVSAQHYSSCLTDQHMLQTGSQSNYGPQNDSGASTIVNQSNSSQTSLLSVSTLVDGQNLSQNLSDIEKNVMGTEGSFSKTHIDTVHHTEIDQSEGKISACDKVQSCCSATVTKVSFGVSESVPGAMQVHPPGNEKSSKAVRSIKFDTIQNTKSVCTPNKVLSYADVVRTPTPDRKPLRQVATSNTPLSSDRSDGYGSLPTSESDSSFNKPYSHNSMPPARLFDVDQAEKENNSKILSKYGFPSLIEGSLFSNKRQLKKNQSFTPGYMQSTKAYSHRTKHSYSRNSNLNSSDGNKHDGQSNKMGIKSAFLSKNPRPLASHMRSKSTSNLSARSAWQF